ncbi:protein RRP5 homolog [Diorhabda sublineata]|uniref:protein RRP5 homolog n=1 Tax=Diorhabda sublineata TaxID=1163346 RepID=UPI0024E09878|nr:protein RRP5 homolog [Diorhabda sublineata]
MGECEESFPRGGTRPRVSATKRKQDDNLFSAVVKPKRKKPRKEKRIPKKVITEDSFHSSLKIRGTLTYNSIRTDMIILGCIRHITNFSLEIELPGLTFGYVNITRISDPFTKYLHSKMEDDDEDTVTLLTRMFKVGQHVLTKVTNIGTNQKGVHVECTINPREIYNDKNHTSFVKSYLVWASVMSKHEHGYEMNIGVNNCRVFLHTKNVDKDRHLFIGEPIWCTVLKCDSSNEASNLRVSSKIEHIKNTKTEDVQSLHDIIPGMKVEILIEEVTNNGVQGKFLNNFFGHIDEGHLNKNIFKYQEGNLITANVLYIDHTIKVTYLTTYDLDLVPEPEYKIGEIKMAEVTSKSHNGVYLTLPSKERCFVTNKRLIHSLPKQHQNINISDSVRLKFALGTNRQCRILDYNRLTRTYIGTLEQSLIKEKLFTTSDVTIGQLLDVTIRTIKPEGLVVTSGHIRGFVPNLFLSNIKYSEVIKKKFKEGLKIKARVLSINSGNIILTLKSGQVDSDQCLTDLSKAKRGDRYPGVIVHTKPEGAVVIFYGNVKGWLDKKYLDEQDDDKKPDPQLFFYVGQVVNPWILGVQKNQVILSLRQPKNFETFGTLAIGQRIKGVVGAVRKDKILVKTLKGRSLGVVPVNHLSETLDLCSTFMKMYKVGDEISDLICINNSDKSILLSRREATALKRTPSFKIRKIGALKVGNLVRCSYISNCDLGIYVLPLIADYTDQILIRNKDIVEKDIAIPKFEPYQCIVTKVLEIQHETKTIRLSAKLSHVFDNRVESVLNLFSQSLVDIQILRNFGKENDWDICQYQPGERIDCLVELVGEQGGCRVKLPNGGVGLVPVKLCPANIKRGDSVNGVFLSQNFVKNYAEICLKDHISQRINKSQDGKIMCSNLSSRMAKVVLTDSLCSICVLKQKDGNRQLIYTPMRSHENDFKGWGHIYQNVKFKICICGKTGNNLIGMNKQLFLKLDKNKATISKIQALRTEKVKKNDKKKKLSIQESIEMVENHITEETDENNDDDESVEEENLEESISETETEDDSQRDMEMDEQENIEENISGTEIEDESQMDNSDIEMDEPDIVEKTSNSKALISGVNSFFQTNGDVKREDSSSDEEDQDINVKKKKKLTAVERAQAAREEEERILKIEKQLADTTRAPESAEEFDRLLLANPNSSQLWTKYIAFHTAATEFDKARAVAKRALEAINIALVDERFNIWIALLNLENMLGTKESFDQTFDEAVKYNDSLQIYLKTIQILAENGKIADMEEKIRKARNKYKHVPQMWLEIAKTYYQIGNFKEARNFKDAALKSIQNKKTQLEIIVKFAIMEFKYGDEDHGAAIFETILSTDPKKVTIWTTYVDQLVKKGNISEARQVLERSVSQRLPLKQMKSLFLKYRIFEEQHGTPAKVEEVKEKAKEYVSKISVN